MIISSCTHVAIDGIISLFFMATQYSIVEMQHSFFLCSFVYGHLGCFRVLAIMGGRPSWIIQVWASAHIPWRGCWSESQQESSAHGSELAFQSWAGYLLPITWKWNKTPILIKSLFIWVSGIHGQIYVLLNTADLRIKAPIPQPGSQSLPSCSFVPDQSSLYRNWKNGTKWVTSCSSHPSLLGKCKPLRVGKKGPSGSGWQTMGWSVGSEIPLGEQFFIPKEDHFCWHIPRMKADKATMALIPD